MAEGGQRGSKEIPGEVTEGVQARKDGELDQHGAHKAEEGVQRFDTHFGGGIQSIC